MTAGGFFPRGRKVCGTLLVETVFDRASATIIDTFMAFTTQRLSVAVQYSAAQEVVGGDLAKWADEKTEPTDKLTLLSGSIASGESRTCLG